MGVDGRLPTKVAALPTVHQRYETLSLCGCWVFALGFFLVFLVVPLFLPKPFRQGLGLFYYRWGTFGMGPSHTARPPTVSE